MASDQPHTETTDHAVCRYRNIVLRGNLRSDDEVRGEIRELVLHGTTSTRLSWVPVDEHPATETRRYLPLGDGRALVLDQPHTTDGEPMMLVQTVVTRPRLGSETGL